MEPVVSHGVFLVSHIQGCGSILICMDPDPTFHFTDRLYPWFRNTVFLKRMKEYKNVTFKNSIVKHFQIIFFSFHHI